MLAAAVRKLDGLHLHITPHDLKVIVGAGIGWGIMFAVGMATMKWWNCAMVCPDEIIITTALSTAVGIVAIGPVALYGRRG